MWLNENWENYKMWRSQRQGGFKTGIADLDSVVSGLTGIVGFQGIPGSCKSTLALQIAVHQAQEGKPVFFYDRENGLERIRERVIANINGIAVASLADSEKVEGYYAKALPALKNIYVETERKSSEAFRSQAIEVLDGFKEPSIVVVDSIQAAARNSPEYSDDRTAIEAWLEELDQMKLDYGATLLMMITSEKSYGGFNTRDMGAAKGTSAIPHKCEIMFNVAYDEDRESIELKVLKNRDDLLAKPVYLEKKLEDSKDSRSFCFRLESGGDYEL